MKNIRFILVTLVMMFMLTGCARFRVDFDIKKNGKVDATMLYAVMESLAGEGGMMSEDEIADMEKSGWKCDPYSEDGYVGYTMSIKDQSINDLAGSVEGSGNGLGLDSDSFTIKKEGAKYIFEASIFDDSEEYNMSDYKSYINMYGGYMEMVMHLPQPAISSNATKVSDDGKTLTWDLLEMKPGEKIHVEFKMSAFNFGIILAIVLILAAVAGVLVFLNKKKNAGQVSNMQGTPMPMNVPPQMSAPTQVNTQPQMETPSQVNTPPQMTPPQANNASGNVFCPQCGTKMAASAVYCSNCGAKIHDT